MPSKFKLRRWAPMQLATYAAVRAISMALRSIAPREVPRVGRALGRLLYTLHPRRKLATRQIAEAEGMPKDPSEITGIAKRMFEGIGILMLENLLMSRILASPEFDRRTRLLNLEVVDQALKRGRGAIFVTAHQMSWEWAGLAGTRVGLPLHSIARPIENPWLDRWITQFRTQTGQRIISKYEPMRVMADALRRNAILGLIADQDARSDGIFVPFFGRLASTARGPALLAMRYRAPIFPIEIWRDGLDIYHIRIDDPIDPMSCGKGEEGAIALTAAYTQRLEQFIRRHPDQWMWLHRRWKSRPSPGASIQ